MSIESSGTERTDEPRRTTSYCRIRPAACGVIVETVGDQIVGVTGDREHSQSLGYTCSKGRAAPEMHHHPGRLDVPMMRADDGNLRPVSWPTRSTTSRPRRVSEAWTSLLADGPGQLPPVRAA